MAYHRYYKVDTRLLRIFNTYGPRMQINDGRVVPNFMSQALRGENLTVYGDGSQTRSFCYVSDEIDGIVRLAKSSEHDPVNIGNPTEFTILECARKVIAVTGSASKIQFEPLPQDDPKQRRPDISRRRGCWDGSRTWIWKTGSNCRWNIFAGPCSRTRRSPLEGGSRLTTIEALP
jgi:dTDP-glucose 4,6-dehydratase